jgi:hypothetical protein
MSDFCTRRDFLTVRAREKGRRRLSPGREQRNMDQEEFTKMVRYA